MGGWYVEAEPLGRRTLSIREHLVGSGHADVAASLHLLAEIFREQGQYAQAEPLFQRALSLREHGLGLRHPATAQTLHDLALLRKIQGNLKEAISLAERALQIHTQSQGDAHPQTIATQTLFTQLLQEEQAAEQGREKALASCEAERQSERAPEEVDLSCSSDNPLQAFLDACCELHPLASCRISELWHAYEQWTALVQHTLPLSRRAFASQIKARGCRPDRTSTMRIWRGIKLINKTT